MPATDDWFVTQQPKLLADGWLFYESQRYDPIIMRGYTPTVVPSYLPNTAASRRKRNRPFYLWIRRTTPNPLDAWTGTLRFAATTLTPWATGHTPPFPIVGGVVQIPDAAWSTTSTGHYTPTWELNPVVDTELNSARDAPTVTVNGTYTDLWTVGPDGTWQTGTPNTFAAFQVIIDLFTRVGA